METKPKLVVAINPPPKDMCCECCGRNAMDVKPFGKAGDPLVGDFDGVRLLKNYRADAPHDVDCDAKISEIMKNFEGKDSPYEDFERLMIEKYGKEETERLMFYDQLINTVSASWECRDCFILSDEEYYDKRYNGSR